jgi:hypothetical protein
MPCGILPYMSYHPPTPDTTYHLDCFSENDHQTLTLQQHISAPTNNFHGLTDDKIVIVEESRTGYSNERNCL